MRLGIRAKLVCLSLLILAGISFGFTALQLSITRGWLEEDLQERAVAFAREVAATIGDRREFESQPLLEAQIRQILLVRRNVLHIDVLRFAGPTTAVIASSDAAVRLPFTHRDAEQIRRGRVLSRLVREERARYWEVMAPVVLEGAAVGAVAAKFSLERADALTARITLWALGLTAASIAIMGVLMSAALDAVVTRPLRRFLAAVDRVRGGDTTATVPVASGDELGLLARHFNGMLARIAAFNDELQGQVRRATAELDRRYQEVQRLNELLFRMQRSLSHAERLALAGRIMAEVAHEIGTPLHSIAGHLELLRKDLPAGALGESAARRLAVVEAQITRVIEIIARLLDLTRRDAGEPAPIDVNRLVAETADLVRPAAAESALALRVIAAPDLPVVHGYPGPLQQVVLNLLTNAIDATPAGGAVEVHTLARPGGEVEVAVRDTGEGIPPERLKRIFEPFFSTKPPGKGTGLGLFIATQIVRAHHGRLDVESAPGAGSTFRLVLPAPPGALR